MATDYWRASSPQVALASGKSMLDIFVETSLAYVNVYRIHILHTTVATISGSMTNFRIYRLTTARPVGAYTTASSAEITARLGSRANQLPLGVTSGTGRTPTRGGAFRQFYYAMDEWDMGAYSLQWLHTLVPYGVVWESLDSRIQPIVCRSGYGVEVRQEGTLAVGSVDVAADFSVVT